VKIYLTKGIEIKRHLIYKPGSSIICSPEKSEKPGVHQFYAIIKVKVLIKKTTIFGMIYGRNTVEG
jgi:hypothetical protein